MTVRVKVPRGPALAAVMVRIEEPVPPEGTKTTGGLNEPEVWAGSPLTNRAMLPEKPLSEESVMVYCAVPGRTTDWLDGVTLMLKSWGPAGVGVLVGVFVGVLLGVLVGVLVGVFVGVAVGVLVGVLVGVRVGIPHSFSSNDTLASFPVAMSGRPSRLKSPTTTEPVAPPTAKLISVPKPPEPLFTN